MNEHDIDGLFRALDSIQERLQDINNNLDSIAQCLMTAAEAVTVMNQKQPTPRRKKPPVS